jgi:hypothetical protein
MSNIKKWQSITEKAGGFDVDLKCPGFDNILSPGISGIISEYIINEEVAKNYPGIEFKLNFEIKKAILNGLADYNEHPCNNFKNFLCSFNGTTHVSRRLLTSALQKFKWFTPTYCSKNLSYSTNTLDGHILDYTGDNHSFYRKFFIGPDSEDFFQATYSFGHVRYDHASNIYNLEYKLTESFLHIVSESLATSYYPLITEKFLYSVVTRGLFLAYAQPSWHKHLEEHFGFRRYTKIFDYRFDSIKNPVERLIELFSMISKFSNLSSDDWRDLHLLESDTIEYNHDHYFSGNYLTILKKYA